MPYPVYPRRKDSRGNYGDGHNDGVGGAITPYYCRFVDIVVMMVKVLENSFMKNIDALWRCCVICIVAGCVLNRVTEMLCFLSILKMNYLILRRIFLLCKFKFFLLLQKKKYVFLTSFIFSCYRIFLLHC